MAQPPIKPPTTPPADSPKFYWLAMMVTPADVAGYTGEPTTLSAAPGLWLLAQEPILGNVSKRHLAIVYCVTADDTARAWALGEIAKGRPYIETDTL